MHSGGDSLPPGDHSKKSSSEKIFARRVAFYCLSIGSVIQLVQQDGELIIKKLPPSFEYGKYSCLVSSVKLTNDTYSLRPSI